ncbi:hypothetical protein K439DRAFT_368086 [Ramaria rubella]|nr:hypothetical protein K439DRAFT_368086 [Ramaria rubella]
MLYASLRLFIAPSNSAAATIVGRISDKPIFSCLYRHLTSPAGVLLHRYVSLPDYTRSNPIPPFPPLMDISAPMVTPDPGNARRPSCHCTCVRTRRPPRCTPSPVRFSCPLPSSSISPCRVLHLEPPATPHSYKAMDARILVFGTSYQVYARD